MPVIILSSDDAALYSMARTLAAHYGDDFYRLAPDLHKKLTQEKMRITFIGHAGSRSYGEEHLSPEGFFNKLKEYQFPFEKISQIDLSGCEIGLRKDDQATFLTEFARFFYQNEETRHITLTGFSDLVFTSGVKRSAMFVMANHQHVKIAAIYGDNHPLYLAESSQDKNPSVARKVELIEKYSQDSVFFNMGTREVLDSNANFKLDFDIFSKQEKFSQLRLQCWAEINNRIAFINQSVEPSDFKENLLKILNEAKENVENVNYDLFMITNFLTKNLPPIPSYPDADQMFFVRMDDKLSKNRTNIDLLQAELNKENPALFSEVNPENFAQKSKEILIDAILKQNIKVVEALLKYGVNFDDTHLAGRTPLTYAVEMGKNDLVKGLLNNPNVNPEQTNAGGWTALALAAGNGNLEIVKALLATGKVNPVYKINDLGWTPFLVAHQAKHQAVVGEIEKFLEEKAQSVTMHAQETPTPSPHSSPLRQESVLATDNKKTDQDPTITVHITKSSETSSLDYPEKLTPDEKKLLNAVKHAVLKDLWNSAGWGIFRSTVPKGITELRKFLSDNNHVSDKDKYDFILEIANRKSKRFQDGTEPMTLQDVFYQTIKKYSDVMTAPSEPEPEQERAVIDQEQKGNSLADLLYAINNPEESPLGLRALIIKSLTNYRDDSWGMHRDEALFTARKEIANKCIMGIKNAKDIESIRSILDSALQESKNARENAGFKETDLQAKDSKLNNILQRQLKMVDGIRPNSYSAPNFLKKSI